MIDTAMEELLRFLSNSNSPVTIGFGLALIIIGLGVSTPRIVRTIADVIMDVVKTRNEIKLARQKSEEERLKAAHDAQKAEDEQMTRIISIMEAQTNQTARFITIAEDFATASNRHSETEIQHIETSKQVATGLQSMAQETKALRISMEAWPKTVDATLVSLVEKIEAVEIALKTSNDDHTRIRQYLETNVMTGIQRVIEMLSEPPPPSPASAPVPVDKTVTNADAAANDATVFAPPELKKTGTEG